MATARATVRPITQGEWDARAVALAVERHLNGAAMYVGESRNPGDQGHVWRVPSRSGRGSYDVLARADRRTDCPCSAGLYGHKPCSHAGSALHGERLRKAATTPTWLEVGMALGRTQEITRRVNASLDRAEASEARRTAMRQWVSGLPWNQCW